MLIHMDDGAELNLLVDDSGNIVVVCSKCKKMWGGKIAPVGTKEFSGIAATALNVAEFNKLSVLAAMGIDKEVVASFVHPDTR